MLSGKPFQLLQVATNAPKEYYFVKRRICSGKEYDAEQAQNVHSFPEYNVGTARILDMCVFSMNRWKRSLWT